jgi:hypothetical protein
MHLWLWSNWLIVPMWPIKHLKRNHPVIQL